MYFQPYSKPELVQTAVVTRLFWSGRWMNGQHLRALPVEELTPMVGAALVEAGVCKDAEGAFAAHTAGLLQGSLELVADVVEQTKAVLAYEVRGVLAVYDVYDSVCQKRSVTVLLQYCPVQLTASSRN